MRRVGQNSGLVADRLTKRLGRRLVLNSVSFTAPAGAITALLGPNGAGKTTTVALAAGLRRPDTGHLWAAGHPAHTPKARHVVALVAQEIAFPGPVTVTRLLDFVESQRAPSPLALPRAELVGRLGLGDVLSRRAGGLSGGQQRKLALALGLLRTPPVVLLDEATTGLDEPSRAAAWGLVRELAGRGVAVLATSHILADIEAHADGVIVLHDGHVIHQASVDAIRARLGGSYVTLDVPSYLRPVLRAAVIAARLGEFVSPASADEPVVIRSLDPLALTRVISDVCPRARGLTVRPVPLGELLDSLPRTSS